jgi:hypothetical protein
MMPSMERAKFLKLSTELMVDLRSWVEEAKQLYDLAPDRMVNLLDGIEYIDHVTVEVAKVKEATEEA